MTPRTALMPSGRHIYIQETPWVCVNLANERFGKRIERAIRKHFKNDPRLLTIHIHGQQFSPWCAIVRWGDAIDYLECPPVVFSPEEQKAETIIGKISEELGRL